MMLAIKTNPEVQRDYKESRKAGMSRMSFSCFPNFLITQFGTSTNLEKQSGAEKW